MELTGWPARVRSFLTALDEMLFDHMPMPPSKKRHLAVAREQEAVICNTACWKLTALV